MNDAHDALVVSEKLKLLRKVEGYYVLKLSL